MGDFRWDISEPSSEETLEQYGGEVELSDLNREEILCRIKTPDVTICIGPPYSGKTNKPAQVSQDTPGNQRIDLHDKVGHLVTLIGVVLLGAGFLAVVVGDVLRGTLDFETYMMAIGSFLAGLGIGSRNKGDPT